MHVLQASTPYKDKPFTLASGPLLYKLQVGMHLGR